MSSSEKSTMFNNNIRCIEMVLLLMCLVKMKKFNNNIRCIEIDKSNFPPSFVRCLITT